MSKLIFEFDCKPKAVQSFRSKKSGNHYQDKDVVDWKRYITISAKSQAPRRKLLTGPTSVKVEFVYEVPKSYDKKFHIEVELGIVRYRIKQPDLTDNLMKGLIDALSGIAWESDKQICKVESRKVYGPRACIRLEAEEIDPIAEIINE